MLAPITRNCYNTVVGCWIAKPVCVGSEEEGDRALPYHLMSLSKERETAGLGGRRCASGNCSWWHFFPMHWQVKSWEGMACPLCWYSYAGNDICLLTVPHCKAKSASVPALKQPVVLFSCYQGKLWMWDMINHDNAPVHSCSMHWRN